MMFLQGLSSPMPQLLGLGEPVFGLTKAGTAYGADPDHSGKTDVLFKSLQQTLNRFVSVAAFAPVAVDGKLGPDSLRAAQTVAKYLAQTFPGQPPVTALSSMTTNIPMLARSSQILFDTLRYYADQKALVAPPIPPRSPPTPTNERPPTPGDTTFPGLLPPQGSNTGKYLLYGVIALGVAGAFYYFATSKKGTDYQEDAAAP